MRSYYAISVATIVISISSIFQTVVGFQNSAPKHLSYYAYNKNKNKNKNGSSFGSSFTSLYANKKQNTADFEYQELKIQLDAMEKQNVPSSKLMPDKKVELERYARQIAMNRPSTIPFQDLEQYIPNTKWRLSFSTQTVTNELPQDATIVLDFGDVGQKTLDYCLEFSKKTLGLNRLVAKSSYTVDSGLVNPGLLTFVYDSITTDVFGLTGIGVGFFGLLKGRSNYIQTIFFDGKVWIDGGVDPMNGNDYFNVYTLIEE